MSACLYDIALCSVAIPFSDMSNIYPRTYMTYDALHGILYCGVVHCIGSCRICVIGAIFMTLARLCFDFTR